MSKVQFLVPIVDDSIYFPIADYFFPKPLVEVCGLPMIVQVIRNYQNSLNISKFIFVISESIDSKFSLSRILSLNSLPEVSIVRRKAQASGGLCSALLAVDEIDDNLPLIVANMDEYIISNIQQTIDKFVTLNVAAGLVSFPSTHPRWCYADIDNFNRVLSVAEKQVISRDALAGFYYFKSKSTFVGAASSALLDGDSIENNFYLSSAINQVLLSGGDVFAERITSDEYHSFFSPEAVHEFERSSFANIIRSSSTSSLLGPDRSSATVNLLIPAAGQGSRFANAGWSAPKPFIDINGQSMLEHVLENLSLPNQKSIVLLRDEHITSFPDLSGDIISRFDHSVTVDALTEGTACTALLARQYIDSNNPLLIANSDQYIDFDVNSFIQDCYDRNLDGSILCFVDPSRNPKWSFAKVDDEGLVLEVAEKNPISDVATVGIYFFAHGSDFVKGSIDMIARNQRVNGEFYTCPVYNNLIKEGARIGIFVIHEDSMHGLGTPSDLNSFLSAKLYPTSSNDPA